MSKGVTIVNKIFKWYYACVVIYFFDAESQRRRERHEEVKTPFLRHNYWLILLM